MSHLTLRDVTLRTSVTYGGPAAPREATTAVTFAKMFDFLPIADVHCCAMVRNKQGLPPSAGRGGNIGYSPVVHLDYLLIAAVYTLITFVRQVIDIPLLQSPLDGHPYTLQPTIYLSTQSQPSTYMAHEAGSCNIPDMSLQR